MGIIRKNFGVLETGEEASLFIMDNGETRITLTDLGAGLVSCVLPSAKHGKQDVFLGLSSLSGYAGPHAFFGVTVGRFANRIENAGFSIGGKKFQIEANEGKNTLHGGSKAWHSRVWSAEVSGDNLRFSLISPDGDGGFPGKVEASVTYSLNAKNELILDFSAVSDAPTPVNMTNHVYFNLRGEGCGNILGHEAKLHCSRYLPVDQFSIPTGELASVEGGAFDFRNPKPIGRDIAGLKSGYDHCFVVDRKENGLALAAEITDPITGRKVSASTTQPGIQFYTGKFLAGQSGKRGVRYSEFSGFCLETQDFPDATNKPQFPNCILEPGKKYAHRTIYAFSW